MDFNDGDLGLTFEDGQMSLFEPLQLHFHSPSEHTVAGKYYDVELHIVHKYKSSDGELGAVIAVFFDREKGGNYENEFINSLNFEEAEREGVPVTNVNFHTFMSKIDTENYWSYNGSLTTPPCTEGIKWTVLSDVQNISDTQLNGMAKWFSHDHGFAEGKGNNRMIQPLNDRTVYWA